MKVIKTGLFVGASAMIPAMALAQATPASAPPAGAATESAPAAGAAAPAATLSAGATVLDTSGGTVGTIDSLDGDYAVLATTKNKVRLPKTSFAMGPNGPVIAMTAAQIDAAAAQAAPQQAAATAKPTVAQGAQVADMQGGAVGTVAAVEGQFATVQLTSGTKVRLPVSAFAAGDNGGLKIAMTAQQLGAAAGASKSGGSGGGAGK